MKNNHESLKKALETGLAGSTGLCNEDYERLGVKREELEQLSDVFINRQYQIALIVDTLIAYPSLIKKVIDLKKEENITEVALATARNSIKPVVEKKKNCAYIYIK
jgi:predicted transcriptional regulator